MEQGNEKQQDSDFTEGLVEAAMGSAVDAIVIIDNRGTIQKANPATVKMFGFDQEELLGQNVGVLMPDPDRSAHNIYLRNYLQTNQKKIIGIGRQVKGQRKDGEIFPMRLSVGEFAAGGHRYFIGTIHDMSAQMAAEQESVRQRTLLKRSSKMPPMQ